MNSCLSGLLLRPDVSGDPLIFVAPPQNLVTFSARSRVEVAGSIRTAGLIKRLCAGDLRGGYISNYALITITLALQGRASVCIRGENHVAFAIGQAVQRLRAAYLRTHHVSGDTFGLIGSRLIIGSGGIEVPASGVADGTIQWHLGAAGRIA